MRISDWSSDVCSSDLLVAGELVGEAGNLGNRAGQVGGFGLVGIGPAVEAVGQRGDAADHAAQAAIARHAGYAELAEHGPPCLQPDIKLVAGGVQALGDIAKPALDPVAAAVGAEGESGRAAGGERVRQYG